MAASHIILAQRNNPPFPNLFPLLFYIHQSMHERNSSLPSSSSSSFLLHYQNLLIIISGTLALQVMQFTSISFTAAQLYATLPYMNVKSFFAQFFNHTSFYWKWNVCGEDWCPFLRYSFAQHPIIKEFSANFSSIFKQFSMLFPCLVSNLAGSNSNLTRDL